MQNPYFPFDALGFQCNPFRALTEDEWTAIAILPPEICELIQMEATNIQILGDAGHGKSTTLRGLTATLREAGKLVTFEYLPLGQHQFKTLPDIIADLDVFLLDEAQRLNRRQLNKLFSIITRHQTRLMIGSHEDFTPRFAKNTLPLSTIVFDGISEQLLGEMLVRRTDYFRTDMSARVYFEADAISYLVTRFGRNLRRLEYYLYEVFQYLAEQQQIVPVSAALLTELDPHLINSVAPE